MLATARLTVIPPCGNKEALFAVTVSVAVPSSSTLVLSAVMLTVLSLAGIVTVCVDGAPTPTFPGRALSGSGESVMPMRSSNSAPSLPLAVMVSSTSSSLAGMVRMPPVLPLPTSVFGTYPPPETEISCLCDSGTASATFISSVYAGETLTTRSPLAPSERDEAAGTLNATVLSLLAGMVTVCVDGAPMANVPGKALPGSGESVMSMCSSGSAPSLPLAVMVSSTLPSLAGMVRMPPVLPLPTSVFGTYPLPEMEISCLCDSGTASATLIFPVCAGEMLTTSDPLVPSARNETAGRLNATVLLSLAGMMISKGEIRLHPFGKVPAATIMTLMVSLVSEKSSPVAVKMRVSAGESRVSVRLVFDRLASVVLARKRLTVMPPPGSEEALFAVTVSVAVSSSSTVVLSAVILMVLSFAGMVTVCVDGAPITKFPGKALSGSGERVMPMRSSGSAPSLPLAVMVSSTLPSLAGMVRMPPVLPLPVSIFGTYPSPEMEISCLCAPGTASATFISSVCAGETLTTNDSLALSAMDEAAGNPNATVLLSLAGMVRASVLFSSLISQPCGWLLAKTRLTRTFSSSSGTLSPTAARVTVTSPVPRGMSMILVSGLKREVPLVPPAATASLTLTPSSAPEPSKSNSTDEGAGEA